MSAIIFTNKNNEPEKGELLTTLGKSAGIWKEILHYISNNYGEPIPEWKFYSKNYGWTLKTLLKKRNLFFMSPFEDYFRISFVFGDKAVSSVQNSNLPVEVINELLNARKYAEGIGILFEVRSKELLETIKMLIDIKIKN